MTQTPPPNQQQYQQYQQPYPQPYYGPPPNLPAAPGAVTSLVCGIIGCCVGCTGLILGPIAIANSKKARAVIAAQPMAYGGSGLATAGMVTGIIATIWGAIAVIYLVVWIVVIVTMTSGGMNM